MQPFCCRFPPLLQAIRQGCRQPLHCNKGWGRVSTHLCESEKMSQPNPFGGTIVHLTPAEVRQGMEDGTILLVDVREPQEIQAESIPGAFALALSVFDVSALPDAEGKRLVFSCRSGQRSQRAAAIAQHFGLPLEEHMMGGIIAWREAGFPVERG